MEGAEDETREEQQSIHTRPYGLDMDGGGNVDPVDAQVRLACGQAHVQPRCEPGRD